MGIIFHCEHCGKKIEAPERVGGKWGKCPSCNGKVFVPAAEDDEEELKLAPVDEEERARQKELLAETIRLRQDILSETDLPPDQGPGGAGASACEMSDGELTIEIISYLRQMADGELAGAETAAKTIAAQAGRAEQILDRIAVSDMPEPELADIPQQILVGLVRDLRGKMI